MTDQVIKWWNFQPLFCLKNERSSTCSEGSICRWQQAGISAGLLWHQWRREVCVWSVGAMQTGGSWKMTGVRRYLQLSLHHFCMDVDTSASTLLLRGEFYCLRKNLDDSNNVFFQKHISVFLKKQKYIISVFSFYDFILYILKYIKCRYVFCMWLCFGEQ